VPNGERKPQATESDAADEAVARPKKLMTTTWRAKPRKRRGPRRGRRGQPGRRGGPGRRQAAQGKRDKAKTPSGAPAPGGSICVARAALLLAASLLVSGFLGWKQWQAHQLNEAGEQARKRPSRMRGADQHRLQQCRPEFPPGARRRNRRIQGNVHPVQRAAPSAADRQQGHRARRGGGFGDRVQSMGKVVVLLFIDQTVTMPNARSPHRPQQDQDDMEKVDGRWRTAKVQLL